MEVQGREEVGRLCLLDDCDVRCCVTVGFPLSMVCQIKKKGFAWVTGKAGEHSQFSVEGTTAHSGHDRSRGW